MKTAEQWAAQVWTDNDLAKRVGTDLFAVLVHNITSAMQQARNATLEEAASVAWPAPDDYEPMSWSEKAALNISKSIRALKDK